MIERELVHSQCMVVGINYFAPYSLANLNDLLHFVIPENISFIKFWLRKIKLNIPNSLFLNQTRSGRNCSETHMAETKLYVRTRRRTQRVSSFFEIVSSFYNLTYGFSIYFLKLKSCKIVGKWELGLPKIDTFFASEDHKITCHSFANSFYLNATLCWIWSHCVVPAKYYIHITPSGLVINPKVAFSWKCSLNDGDFLPQVFFVR